MATDSWAQAVDEQEAAAESVCLNICDDNYKQTINVNVLFCIPTFGRSEIIVYYAFNCIT